MTAGLTHCRWTGPQRTTGSHEQRRSPPGAANMSDPFNLPEAEYVAVMTEIDEKLRQKSDRVPGREILGLAEYCAKFQVTLANNHPTTKRIINWFSQMYGDRLGMDWDFGRTEIGRAS